MTNKTSNETEFHKCGFNISISSSYIRIVLYYRHLLRTRIFYYIHCAVLYLMTITSSNRTQNALEHNNILIVSLF